MCYSSENVRLQQDLLRVDEVLYSTVCMFSSYRPAHMRLLCDVESEHFVVYTICNLALFLMAPPIHLGVWSMALMLLSKDLVVDRSCCVCGILIVIMCTHSWMVK